MSLFVYGKKRNVPWWTSASVYGSSGASGGEPQARPGYTIGCTYVRWGSPGAYRYQNYTGVSSNFISAKNQINKVFIRVTQKGKSRPDSSAVDLTANGTAGQVTISGSVKTRKSGAARPRQQVGVYAWLHGTDSATLGHECDAYGTSIRELQVGAGPRKVFGTDAAGRFNGRIGACFPRNGDYDIAASTWQSDINFPALSPAVTVTWPVSTPE